MKGETLGKKQKRSREVREPLCLCWAAERWSRGASDEPAFALDLSLQPCEWTHSFVLCLSAPRVRRGQVPCVRGTARRVPGPQALIPPGSRQGGGRGWLHGEHWGVPDLSKREKAQVSRQPVSEPRRGPRVIHARLLARLP